MRGARSWVVLGIILIAALELHLTGRFGQLWSLAFGGADAGLTVTDKTKPKHPTGA
jgi:hypothetical protein